MLTRYRSPNPTSLSALADICSSDDPTARASSSASSDRAREPHHSCTLPLSPSALASVFSPRLSFSSISLNIGQHPSLPLSPSYLLYLFFILADLFADSPSISTKVLNYLQFLFCHLFCAILIIRSFSPLKKKKLAGCLCE